MNTEPNNPQPITSTPTASLSRRTFIKKAAGTALVFGIGITLAPATTVTPNGDPTWCGFSSPGNGVPAPSAISCRTSWVTSISYLSPGDVAALQAAVDQARYNLDHAGAYPSDSWVQHLEDALTNAEAALAAAIAADATANACSDDQGGGGSNCTRVSNPACLPFIEANHAAAYAANPGPGGPGPVNGSSGQCLW